MKYAKALLFSSLLVLAASLQAGEVDQCESECGVSCYPMRISICPAGDFEYIRDSCGGCCDYIWVCVRNYLGEGVAGVPWTDYWLNACDPAQELCLCAQPVVADSLTNADGYTTISSRIAAGGCVLTDGLYLAVQGKIILAKPACSYPVCLDIILVSPDMTADCVVNLSDLAIFGLGYNLDPGKPGYNPCCDFNDDAVCNLSDFAHFGGHYLHSCF